MNARTTLPFLLLLLVPLSGCAGLVRDVTPQAPPATATPPPATATPRVDAGAEEYAAYNDVVGALYARGHQTVVISDVTNPGVGDIRDWFEQSKSAFPELKESTRASFLARNDRAYMLEPRFTLGVRTVLINAGQFEGYFGKNGSGWDGFYANYPGAQGVLTLSRVGFSDDGTQALIYMGNQSYWLAGEGWMRLLVKQGGTWSVAREVMMWIS